MLVAVLGAFLVTQMARTFYSINIFVFYFRLLLAVSKTFKVTYKKSVKVDHCCCRSGLIVTDPSIT